MRLGATRAETELEGGLPRSGQVVNGALWNYAGAVAASLLQLGYTAYTGRTVSVAAFGAYASALSMAQLLGYFANAGLATAVLRTGEPSRHLFRAALRLGMFSGVVCFAVVQMAAPVWAALWNAPQATGLLRVLGCQFLVLPAAAVATAGLRLLLAQRAAVFVETGAQLAGLIVGTLLLAHGWNPVGLAVAPVTTQVCTALLAGIVLAGRLPDGSGQPSQQRLRLRELAGSSGFLGAHQLAQYATNTLPLWTAGALFGPVSVGCYSRAALFTGLPLTMLATGLTRVVTPALARVRAPAGPGAAAAGLGLDPGHAPEMGESAAFRRAASDVLVAASALSFLPFGLLAGIGPDTLRLLLGPGWDEAARLVPWLSIGAAAGLLYSIALSVDTVRGSVRPMTAAQAAAAATTGAGVLLTAAEHSLVPLVICAAVGQLCGHAVLLRAWGAEGVVESRRMWAGYGVHIALGAVLYAVGTACSQLIRGHPAPVAVFVLLLGGLVAVACYPLRGLLPLYRIASDRGLIPLSGRSQSAEGI